MLIFYLKMEARLREINSQIEKMILLLGGEISQEMQAEEVQAEEVQAEVGAEEVQVEEVQAEEVKPEEERPQEVQAEEEQAEEVQAEETQAEEAEADEVQAEEAQTEEVQAEKIQAEAIPVQKEDSMPEEEKQEHPHLPVEPSLANVPEEPEPSACKAAPPAEPELVVVSPEITAQEDDAVIAECSPTKNNDPQAVADDYETAEEIFKKAAEAGLAVRQ